MSARDRILARVRDAVERRARTDHPGEFEGWRPTDGESPHAEPVRAATTVDLLERFTDLLEDAGGEWMRFEGETAAMAWARNFAEHFDSVAIGKLAYWPLGYGADAPIGGAPPYGADAAEAELGVSLALGAVAETGSLILGSQDHRRVQLLPPVHLVLLEESRIFATLAQALAGLRGADAGRGPDDGVIDLDAEIPEGLPSAIGLHSGPSKSADIGQILVKGVHGPGRLVVVVVGGG